MLEFTLPIRLVNPLNNRRHWRTVHARGKREKDIVALRLYADRGLCDQVLPVRVELTRIGKKKMDSDSLTASFKHVRDGVSFWLGCDDGDESKVTWRYVQEIGKEYAVRVRIEEVKA